MICTVCGSENNEDAKVCVQCGTPLPDDPEISDEGISRDDGRADALQADCTAKQDDPEEDLASDGAASEVEADSEACQDDDAAMENALESDGETTGGEDDVSDDPFEALRSLPEMDTVAMPQAVAPVDVTAIMPPLEPRGPIRYSTGDRDREEARRRRIPKVPMIVAGILAVIMVIGVYLLAQGWLRGGINVPNVVGMSSDAARTQLIDAGFQVDTTSQTTEENFGMVLSSDPQAGTKARRGSKVTITVSASRTIPDVVGMDLSAAQNRLSDEGATNVNVEEKASNQPKGTVISIEPEAGCAFNPDDAITLTVATSAAVPDVVGMTEDEASAALKDVGYIADVKWADSTYEAGTVVSTNPEAGTEANLNTKVSVYVASPGPRDIYHVMDYFDAPPASDSQYMAWKGFKVYGGYSYDADGATYTSAIWQHPDGSTMSFTPVPYLEDKGLSTEDYLAEGYAFQGVRLYIPSHSASSLGTDVSMNGIQAYMDACGLSGITDYCTQEDVESSNGADGSKLGLPPFICAQGETDGRIWSILITESAAYIGCGPRECYEDMDPICDNVAINELYTS